MGLLWQALSDMVISGAGLLLVGGAYALWWLSGFIPNLFSDKKWSWKRGLQDLCKVLLVAVVLIAGSGLADIGSEFFNYLGWDIREQVEAFSSFALIGAMSVGFVYYLGKAINNALNFIKLKWSDKQGSREKFDEAQDAISENIRDFVETITGKTSKEDIESDPDAPKELRDYIEVDEEVAGKGGVNNTYPNPYRDAPQDTLVDPSTCYNRECVSYCAWKINEVTGSWPRRTGGMNAKDWVARLTENGYKEVSAPQNGGKYVGVSTAGTYGHVVWFEEGSTISEYNYSVRGGFSVRTINLGAYRWMEIKSPAKSVKKSNEEIANEVIAGEWGNDPIRSKHLAEAGYDPEAIRAIVNAKLAPTQKPAAAPRNNQVTEGSKVRPTKLVDYTGTPVYAWDQYYIVTQLNGSRAVLTSPRGGIWAAMNVRDLEVL